MNMTKPDEVERAERILHLALPEVRSRDQAMAHLWYVDPNNEQTRLWSIAAAAYILKETNKL